jgi:hypothetical protein
VPGNLMRVGPTRLPPSAYIPRSANKKGQREYKRRHNVLPPVW